MTEQEAKTKWCPFARAQTQDTESAPAVNRTLQGGIDIGCHCIGSACMAWRWAPLVHHTAATNPVDGRGSGIAGYAYSVAVEGPGRSATEGFCGLAGKP